jgi:hypothetical protein
MISWIRRTIRTGAGEPADTATEASRIRADWDRLRSEAVTPRERAEIDAIFSRHAA